MKAIITDLDRTLLHTDKSVSPYTVETLRQCRMQGLRIMAASARPVRDILPFHHLIGFDAIAATNGAVVRLPQQELHFALSHNTAEQIITALLAFPDVFLSIETSTGLYANRDIPEWQPVLYSGFPRLPADTAVYKILASSPCRRLYDEVADILPADAYHILAGHDLLQIMSTQATKWHAVQHMLSHFGISPNEAVYFGDDNDDIESLRMCGIGAAVSNAIPAALAAADYVVPSNDADGAASFLQQHILSL